MEAVHFVVSGPNVLHQQSCTRGVLFSPKDRNISTAFGAIVDNLVKPSAQCLAAVKRANNILAYAESVLGYKRSDFIVLLYIYIKKKKKDKESDCRLV